MYAYSLSSCTLSVYYGSYVVTMQLNKSLNSDWLAVYILNCTQLVIAIARSYQIIQLKHAHAFRGIMVAQLLYINGCELPFHFSVHVYFHGIELYGPQLLHLIFNQYLLCIAIQPVCSCYQAQVHSYYGYYFQLYSYFLA